MGLLLCMRQVCEVSHVYHSYHTTRHSAKLQKMRHIRRGEHSCASSVDWRRWSTQVGRSITFSILGLGNITASNKFSVGQSSI